jgi:hypothetical protein
MHRADPYASRLSPRRRDRHDPIPARDGPASSLLQPPPHLGPAPLTPQRARVTIRDTPRAAPRRRGTWIGGYRVHVLDVITIVLGIAVLVAIFWLQ